MIRESRAVEGYRLPADPAIDVSTLLLTGERGPDHLRDAVNTLGDRLGDARINAFDGVGHVGIESVPDRVATAVNAFLE